MTPASVRRLAVISPPLLFLLLAVLVEHGYRRARESEHRVAHAESVISELELLRRRLTDAETGARAFAITGEDAHLELQRRARPEAEATLRRLGALLADRPERAGLESLLPLVRARFDHADGMIALRRRGELPAPALAPVLARGKALMDSARSGIARLEGAQKLALREELRGRARYVRLASVQLLLGTVASAVVMIGINALLLGYSRRAEAAAREAAERNGQLEEQAVELEILAAELEEHTHELEEAGRARRAHEEYLRTVIDTAPDVIFAQDGEGRIRMANQATAEVLGAPLHAIVGSLHSQLNPHEEDVRRLDAQIQPVLATGRSSSVERVVADPISGARRWYETRVVPLGKPGGGLAQALVVGTDITPWRRAEEAARQAQQEVLVRLSHAAEFRDDATGCHTRRVGRLTGLIAKLLGLDAEEAALIEQAAPLHDVGKIGIPDAILLKPGRLTAEELAVMRSHALIGGKLLSGGSSALMTLAERIAVSHHERWDGAGYPHGLREEEIPRAARLVAVADVVDALSHDRPYRAAWSHAQVLAEVRTQRGRMFDPTCADACVEILAAADARTLWLEA